MADNTVHAAGAVVTRGEGPQRTFLVVHRGYRADWTFPKGKVDPGEHLLATAIREVREETGLAVRLGLPLPSIRYESQGKPKISHYWHATELAGDFVANDEVDEVAWATLSEAQALLTYEHDRAVLEAANAAVDTTPFVVLRHTQAMKRTEWASSGKSTAGLDQRRPLTAVGRMQAQGLVPALAALGIERIHASGSVRCRDTVGPYASARGLAIVAHTSITEEQHLVDQQAAHSLVAGLAVDIAATVVCTHRPVMATAMGALAETFRVAPGAPQDFDPALTPGSMAVFHRDRRDPRVVVAIERHKR